MGSYIEIFVHNVEHYHSFLIEGISSLRFEQNFFKKVFMW